MNLSSTNTPMSNKDLVLKLEKELKMLWQIRDNLIQENAYLKRKIIDPDNNEYIIEYDTWGGGLAEFKIGKV